MLLLVFLVMISYFKNNVKIIWIKKAMNCLVMSHLMCSPEFFTDKPIYVSHVVGEQAHLFYAEISC